jgi:ABC-type nitrate/sulfonate/bicarbonate transport system substrate-binding protein
MQFRKLAVFAFRMSLVGIWTIVLFHRLAYPAETERKKVTIAYTSYSPSAMWFLLEKELGYFREEGLRPEFVLVRGGGIAIKGLIARNFDYAHAPVAVIDAIVRGSQPFKLIFTAGMVHFWLIGRPEIRSITDLKGKAVGTGSPGSISDFAMREIFKRHGLDPLRDTTFLGIGASRERFVALTSGAVHATFLSPPFDFKALEMGYRRLASASDYVTWPQTALGTTEEKTLREPEDVYKIVRASLKGLKFVFAEREYVLSKMIQMLRLTREEAVQSYESLREEYVPSGYLTEQVEREVISLLKQAANVKEDIPPERVFNNRFVKQAEQELKGWRPQAPR